MKTFHILSLLAIASVPVLGGSLTGSVRSIPRDSTVNLSTNGTLDWVHWGLYTETSLNRKTGVTAQISDFAPLDNTNGFVAVYQFADNYNGYTWTDGNPIAGVTNTTTGVWAYGIPVIGTGFQITAPADTTVRTLKVFCGVFAGAGNFVASLSDGSAAEFTDSFSNVPGNGPSREVTLRYAANSPNQTLTVRWTLRMPGGSAAANVTLQAATLSAEGVNNPPVVHLTNPAPDASIAAGSNVSLAATASDLDGSIARVEFFVNGAKTGEDTTGPYAATWPSPAPGRYILTAVATDNGGETTTSGPVEVTIYKPGGSLSGVAALPPQSVNLTTEGSTDWVHWGYSPSNQVNRKSGIAPLIGELDLIGTPAANVYTDNYTGFSWNNGTPTESADNLHHGFYVSGLGKRFEIVVPADTTPRQLRVYGGLYAAEGHFQAWLSDLSAPTYHDHSLSNYFGNDYGQFTLNYAAASSGQSLTVRYVAEKLYDADFGNVTIQAATLQGGGGVVVLPVQILNPMFSGANLRFDFQTQSGVSYTAQWLSTLGQGTWQTFATLTGNGGLVSVTNNNPTGTQRFYRVSAQ